MMISQNALLSSLFICVIIIIIIIIVVLGKLFQCGGLFWNTILW